MVQSIFSSGEFSNFAFLTLGHADLWQFHVVSSFRLEILQFPQARSQVAQFYTKLCRFHNFHATEARGVRLIKHHLLTVSFSRWLGAAAPMGMNSWHRALPITIRRMETKAELRCWNTTTVGAFRIFGCLAWSNFRLGSPKPIPLPGS